MKTSVEKLLTRQQVAKLFGVHQRTIREWTNYYELGLKYIKVNNTCRYRVSDVEDFIKTNYKNLKPEHQPNSNKTEQNQEESKQPEEIKKPIEKRPINDILNSMGSKGVDDESLAQETREIFDFLTDQFNEIIKEKGMDKKARPGVERLFTKADLLNGAAPAFLLEPHEKRESILKRLKPIRDKHLEQQKCLLNKLPPIAKNFFLKLVNNPNNLDPQLMEIGFMTSVMNEYKEKDDVSRFFMLLAKVTLLEGVIQDLEIGQNFKESSSPRS